MRYIFIVNPKAGQAKGKEQYAEDINVIAETLGVPFEVYFTKGIGDAETFTRSVGESAAESGEEVRIVACGGDGTLNEVLNGAIAYDNLVVGVVPMGTGNDFARNFPEAGDFLSVKAQLMGSVVKCDCIRYHGMLDHKEQTRYCANMFNIGFDCNVVDTTAVMKTKPLMAGSMAYLASVATTLIKKKGANLRIVADGEEISNGPILLTSIANGSYCGGGVMSNPYASVHDGKIDLSVINIVSRTKFITLFPSYSKGTLLEKKSIEKIITNLKADHVEITPLDDKGRLCTDGEISDMEGTIEFDVIKDGFNLLIPKKFD